MTETTNAAPPANPFRKAVDALAAISVAVAGAALLGLVLVQAWQVFARYVLNDSPPWTAPVTLVLLSAAMSFGAAAGVHGNRHFGFFLLAQSLRPRAKRVVDAIVCLVVAAIGAVLACDGWLLWRDGLGIRMAGAPLPESAGYLPLSLGGVLMVVFAVDRLAAVLVARGADGER